MAMMTTSAKRMSLAWLRWLIPVIPDIWEAEIGRIIV
jgi:hypothetical protein